MDTRHLSADQGFAHLEAASHNSNVKLRQVAKNLGLTGELPTHTQRVDAPNPDPARNAIQHELPLDSCPLPPPRTTTE